MYSQNNEEQIIAEYFGDFTGTFLDIGANDGKTFSNTAKLVELGWDGVMVEPSPATFKKCQSTHKDNKVVVLNAAVSDKVGWVEFFETSDTLLSSMNESLAKSWGVSYEKIKVQSIKFIQLTHHYGSFDFISIDAEGMDLTILKQINLTKTKLICIEAGPHESEMKQYCEGFGMKLIHRNFENLIMGK